MKEEWTCRTGQKGVIFHGNEEKGRGAGHAFGGVMGLCRYFCHRSRKIRAWLIGSGFGANRIFHGGAVFAIPADRAAAFVAAQMVRFKTVFAHGYFGV